MKECPKCHTQYDDSMNFCTNDGCRLVDVSAPSSNNQIRHTQTKKKGGCLKKIIVSTIIVVIAMIAFYNYIMNAATYLRAEPNQIGSVKAGGDCKVEIDYDGYVWLINHKPEWVDIDENDNDFTIRVSPNQTGQAREGSITIQSGKQLAQVVIKQMGYATRIKASENALNFSSSGGKETITIATDGCGWKAQFPEWISVREDEDGVVISCQRNSAEYRTGNVIFKEDNVSTTVYITQGGLCNDCHGNGETSCSSCWGMGGSGYGMFYTQCLWCGGSGKIKCGLCGGSGNRE